MKKNIYILFVVLLIVLIGNSIYKEVNKKSTKSVRLECHNKVTVFEKLHKPKLLMKLKNDINNGKLQITKEIEKSKYMESKLFNYVDEEQITSFYESLLNRKNLANEDSSSSVNILIYENDKEDPGKKTKKAKLYAGYIVFSYKTENSLVYKIQIDFLDDKGSDINKTLKCGLESVMTL